MTDKTYTLQGGLCDGEKVTVLRDLCYKDYIVGTNFRAGVGEFTWEVYRFQQVIYDDRRFEVLLHDSVGIHDFVRNLVQHSEKEGVGVVE
ncbi:MAG: hypothetical protein ACRDDY_12820, partial [Clostridium sp.]|uniref:hypothetical protein n=1 Tax=Clostridium sp. TaxID=1506 RepID=UPI003EE7E0B3